MGKIRDIVGNELKEGDFVSFYPRNTGLWIAKIVEVKEGGVSLSIDKNKAMTPAQIRIVMDVTLTINPMMPIFHDLVRIAPPGADEIVNKIMGGSEEPPKPS